MQFESLKVFCDVGKYRSFSQAAQNNNVSQSAASQIVLQLERRLGVQLVNRSTRPLRLTPLGRAYYDGCKGLVEQYQELEASIQNVQSQIDANVQVAAIYSVGLSDMGKYVEEFIQRHPNSKIQVEYLHPNRVYEKVLEGRADFGLVSFPRKSRDLCSLPWREEEMVLVCAPAHEFAGEKAIHPSQLQGQKYVGFDRGLVIRREVDRFLREQGVTVEYTLEFDNIENIKKAVEVSAGIALLPEPTLRREVEAGTLIAVPLTGGRLVRPLGILQKRHNKLGSTALRFIELLRQQGNANGRPTEAAPNADESDSPNGQRSRNGAVRVRKTRRK